MNDRVSFDGETGEFDELAAAEVDVHLERLDDAEFHLRLSRGGETVFAADLFTAQGKLHVTVLENSVGAS